MMNLKMPRFFLIGNIEGNSGVTNVNKGIVRNLTPNFTYLHSRGTLMKAIESLRKTLMCKVIVVSGVSRCGMYMMKVAKIFRKRSIYIMHGSVEMEATLNDLWKWKSIRLAVKYERDILKDADLVLPVSQRFCEQLQLYYPEHKNKFKHMHNGVEKKNVECHNYCRNEKSIIAVGGDRKVKNNWIVANALKKIGEDYHLSVYGAIYDRRSVQQNRSDESNIFKGLIPQDELYNKMAESELYVLNSIYEPFALSVFDALMCGCSVLISNKAGALELLEVTEHDVIFNPMDEDEIAEKIAYLLQHPNNKRIVSKLNWNEISYSSEVRKLERFCSDLLYSS